MWTCQKCGRIFHKRAQPHSCHKIPLEQHFENKDKAKELFDRLVKQIDTRIGKCRIISIPCCVHLFGDYDFLAALPKKDRLEIRFALNRRLDSPRLKQCVPMSAQVFKNCLDVATTVEIDEELIGWLGESYHLKEKG
jgi:hypothetical protein